MHSDMNSKFLSLCKSKSAFLACFGTILSIFSLLFGCDSPTHEARPDTSGNQEVQSTSRIIRSKGPGKVNKLLFTEPDVESIRLNPLKTSLTQMVSGYLSQGYATSISIHFLDLGTSEWISVNPSIGYTPGSLIKVPVVLSFLKKSEQEPAFLDHKLYFDPAMPPIPAQTFIVDPIQRGQYYPVRELLRRVIRDSDNYSTSLINHQIDYRYFNTLYDDLGQTVPDMHNIEYTTNVVDYSRFLTVLYNASWLNEVNSEMILGWMSESPFKEGMTRTLPQNVVVAHKFGEYGTSDVKQWHESGIVFDKKPYLLTIMTRGADSEKLRIAMGEISRAVYSYRNP